MPEKKGAEKAYRNLQFLNSPDARTIRMLSEFYEPQARLRKFKINNIIVFFGSARSDSLKNAKKKLGGNLNTNDNSLKLAQYYEDAVELAYRLTNWSKTNFKKRKQYHICSGGGPGIMEAANRGAQKAGGKSIGFNISLPMEQYPNTYIDDDLNFEFHYFFMRKFWFVYLAKAIVVFPGGFGTIDECFEVLTLVQTKKTTKNLPIVMYGTDYWNSIINFDELVKWGTIAEEDLELIHFCDDVNSAFKFLTKRINGNTNEKQIL